METESSVICGKLQYSDYCLCKIMVNEESDTVRSWHERGNIGDKSQEVVIKY